jgi:RNase P subunit RPR2
VQAPEKNATRHADYLTVLCPTTQSSIQTSVTTDVRALAKAWHSKIKVSCLHCGEVHLYRVCEAFVEAAISHARLRGDSTIVAAPNPLRPHAR